MDNLLPEMSDKFDIVVKQLMLSKKEMGSTVKKDSNNPFHKSKYASLGAHLDLCEETLDKHGLILFHSVNGSYEKPLLIATICHAESGQWIKSYLPLPNIKGDSQGLGASITYMRRYSINSMLGLTAEDDDGETACGRGKNDSKKEPPKQDNKIDLNEKLNEDQINSMRSLIKNLDAESAKSFWNWASKTFDANKIEQIPKAAYEKCTHSLNAKIKFLKDQEKVVA